jgi:dolichyl-phosphate beta-glucosyltransferase
MKLTGFCWSLFFGWIQIIIVDDGSKDNTVKIGFEYVKKYGLDVVRILKQGINQGKGAAVRKVLMPECNF